jgi:homoserine O-acetyltransferase
VSAARKFFQYPGEFAMRRGSTLRNPVLAYETWGNLNESGDNAVMIFTGLSPSAHACSSPADPAPGWWEEMVGPSRPIDTRHHFVVCMNSLGSCFGSTGPASIDPASGQPYRLRFPVLTLEDVATAGKALLDHLGVRALHTLAGPSMGGMTALAFAVQNPLAAARLLLISTAARAAPFAIALRSLQREMIRRDPEWAGGDYPPGKGPVTGMRLARKLGMMTYRSPQEWEQRFGRERIAEERQSGDSFALDFEIEAYLESHAKKFSGQFDANCYLYLSRAMDLFDLCEHGDCLSGALADIRARHALVIGVTTDFLFPIHQQRELAEALKGGCESLDFRELPSIQGHDSFLVDMDRFRPVIAEFLARP